MRRVTDRVSAVDQARRVRSVRVGRVLLEQGWLRESTPRGGTRELHTLRDGDHLQLCPAWSPRSRPEPCYHVNRRHRRHS